MKIKREKQIAFLNKVLKETQSDARVWQRTASDSVSAHSVFPDDALDSEGVFEYRAEKFKGVFWIAMKTSGRIIGVVGCDTNYTERFDDDDDEIGHLLTRIFYMIFDYYPSAEAIIDAYLNDA